MKILKQDRKSLEIKEFKLTHLLTILLLIVVIFPIIPSMISYKNGFIDGKNSEINEKDVVLLYMESQKNSFTRANFYNYLKEVNIKFPEVVFAQAIKESGLTSSLFKENNNPFGMKIARKRPNVQKGEQNGHAYYDTWKDAVLDYALYQSYVGLSKLKTKEEYFMYLKELKYFDVTNPVNVNYLKDLKEISDNIEKYIK